MERLIPSTAYEHKLSWADFNLWADDHGVPHEPPEDWEYLWECWLAATEAASKRAAQ